MKKYLYIFIIIGVLLTGFIIWIIINANSNNKTKINNNESNNSTSAVEQNNGYRKITYQADLSVQPNQLVLNDANSGALMCLPRGKVNVELYFPASGSNAVKQNNTITLTDYKCYNYGTSQACEVESLNSEAYAPFSFTFSEAVLEKNYDKDGDTNLDGIKLKKEIAMAGQPVSINATCTDSGSTTLPSTNYAVLPDFFAYASKGEEKYYTFETILGEEINGSNFDTVFTSAPALHYYISEVKYSEKIVDSL